MNKKLCLADILNKANEIKNVEERRTFLRQYDSSALRMILQMINDDTLRWDLPMGAPPYVPNKELDCYGILMSQIKKLPMFFSPENGGRPDIPKMKKETLFIQLLESIDKADAEMLIKIKDNCNAPEESGGGPIQKRKHIYKNLERSFLIKTFPGIPIRDPELADE